MIMGHVGNTAFLPRQKPILPGHVGDTAFLHGQKLISSHSEHLAVLPLTLYMISNRQTCRKEKCMIAYDMAIFISSPHINPRHPYRQEGQKPSG